MRKAFLISLVALSLSAFSANATPTSIALGAGINFGQHPGIVVKLPGSPTFVELYYSIPGQNDGIDIRAYSYLLDVPLGSLFSLNLSPSFEFGSSPLFTSAVTYSGLIAVGLRLGISIWPLKSLEVALAVGFLPTLSLTSQAGVAGSTELSAGYGVPMEATVRYYLGD